MKSNIKTLNYMIISPRGGIMDKISCGIVLDETQKEMGLKGTQELPVSIFNDNLILEPVPYHWHDEIELIVVIEGQMELVVELEKHVILQGEGVFINSGRLHSCAAVEQNECVIKSFVFHSRFIYGDIQSNMYENYFREFLSEGSTSTCHLSKSGCSLVLNAYDEFLRKEFAYEFLVRQKLTDTLVDIIKNTEKQELKIDSKLRRQFDRCKLMMTFIQQHYQSEISLLDIAQSAQIKESEALRCFKSALKTSPIKYLKNYRLEQAALRLKNTNHAIIHIGLDCGFYEMSYFAKSFKEHYGCTPSAYRKNYES